MNEAVLLGEEVHPVVAQSCLRGLGEFLVQTPGECLA